MMKVTGLNWVRALGKRKGLAALAVAAALPLVATACEHGAYQVDIFPEQHYQQSIKKQEPPRLSAPDGAVPITGREVPLDFADADKTPNPLSRTPEVLTHGADVFRVNCSMCHGLKAQGDGTVGDKLVQYGYARPPNLTAQATQSKSDGALFWTISNGVVVMPKFSLLLSEQDRWSAVQYLRFLAQQGQ